MPDIKLVSSNNAVVPVASQRPKRFRKKLLIYPKFQLGLIAATALVNALVFVSVGLLVQRAFDQLFSMGVEARLPLSHAYFKFLNYESTMLASHILVGFGVSFVVSSIFTLILSNKLAGPIIRLRGYFKDIADSGQEPLHGISFRKGDFFSDLPTIINKAFCKLGIGNHTAEVHDEIDKEDSSKVA